MGPGTKIIFVIISSVFAIVGLKFHSLTNYAPALPKIEDTNWGPKNLEGKQDTTIKPFKVNVPDKVLKDLQSRLENSRPFYPPLENIAQQYGMNSKLLTNIVDFWKTKYNWREREEYLNKFPQFTTNIQGLNIHYIHVKPKNTKNIKVYPLLLVHGWPGSIREFTEIIPILTTPQKGRDFVFEVIAPSLPGYGFSDAAVRPGLSAARIAIVLKNLMLRVGFERFYTQGGDWGAGITINLATMFPQHVIGMHSNMCISSATMSNLKLLFYSLYPSAIVSKDFEHKLYPVTNILKHLLLEFGYMHLQATKPDTVGVALNDSPVGLAAYILEKFTTWTNEDWKNLEDGGLTRKYTYTALLDNVMVYWVTGSITTSMRLYSEHFADKDLQPPLENIPLTVPSGCAAFKHEIFYQPPALLEDKFHNLIHMSHFDDGGHFAAFEVPKILAEDIFVFVEKVQQIPKSKLK